MSTALSSSSALYNTTNNLSTTNSLWKTNDTKAMKTGEKRAIYWVKKKLISLDEKHLKLKSFETSVIYQGEWQNNLKHGFGKQTWKNGDKYEGMWENNKRNGNGTYWKLDTTAQNGKEIKTLRKLYHGQWVNNLKEGMGVFYYPDGSRYEGEWMKDMRHGKGNLYLANNESYKGEWIENKKCGFANGDQYSGQYLNDLREGQGQLFYVSGKIFDGEWVMDKPKCGIYTNINTDSNKLNPINPLMPKNLVATQTSNISFPELQLSDPDGVLAEQISNIQSTRAPARSIPFIALSDLFNEEELDSLRNLFSTRDFDNCGSINVKDLPVLFEELALTSTPADISQILIDLHLLPNSNLTFIDFVKALYLLQASYLEETAEKYMDDKENNEDLSIPADSRYILSEDM